MTKKLSIVVIMMLAVLALLQGCVFAEDAIIEEPTMEPIVLNGDQVFDLTGKTITGPVIVESGNITITGNGTITSKKHANPTNGTGVTEDGDYATLIVKGGNVTINGGNFISDTNLTTKVYAALYVKGDSVVTVNGGTFTGNGKDFAVRVCGESGNATVTVKGGTFQQTAASGGVTANSCCGGRLEIAGGTWTCNSVWEGVADILMTAQQNSGVDGEMYVSGGKFKNFNPAKNVYVDGPVGSGEYKYENKVVNGSMAVRIGDYYQVMPETTSIEITGEMTGPIVIEKGDVLIYGDGTLKSKKHANATSGTGVTEDGEYATLIVTGGNVTINSGNFVSETNLTTKVYAALYVKGNSTVTVNGGTFTGKAKDFAVRVCGESGKAVVKVNDGTFEQVAASGAVTANSCCGGILQINGGTWTCNSVWEGVADILMTAQQNSGVDGVMEVAGGKFKNFNPEENVYVDGPVGSGIYRYENKVVDGYKAVEKDGYYEIVCAHKNPKLHEQVEPTYTTEGVKVYYECTKCGKIFKDLECTSEMQRADLTIPKLATVVNGTAVVTPEAVTNGLMDSEEAKKDVVVLPVVETNKEVSKVELPTGTIHFLADNEKALEIQTSSATVTLDKTTMEEVAKQVEVGAVVTIEVNEIKEDTLTKEQQNVIENKDVAFVFKAEMFADGKEISNFGGGKVKVAIPFTPEENTNGSDYKVFYIADDGSISEVLTQYVDGKLVFELEHFSEYAVVNVKQPAPAGSGAPAAEPTKDNTPKTGAVSIAVVLMVIASVGYVVTKKEIR